MAIITNNYLVEGLRGMVGKTLVFRMVRGKMVVGNRPKPAKKQSEQQRANRSKFREASVYAKNVLKDPVRKAYYQKKAKKLKLPNAYTAAITDYMRRPVVVMQKATPNGKLVTISKKDFAINKGEVIKKNGSGVVTVLRSAVAINSYQWQVTLGEGEMLRVRDDTGNSFVYSFDSEMMP